jgi:hypothetical protein
MGRQERSLCLITSPRRPGLRLTLRFLGLLWAINHLEVSSSGVVDGLVRPVFLLHLRVSGLLGGLGSICLPPSCDLGGHRRRQLDGVLEGTREPWGLLATCIIPPSKGMHAPLN